MDLLTSNSISLSLLTIISLIVNGITIYKWFSDRKKQDNINNQAYEMLRGLALGNTRRVNMIVKRIDILKKQESENEEFMIFLENMWGESKSNIENLLAATKALKPSKAKDLPYDGDALLNQSIFESNKITLRRLEQETKLGIVQNEHSS